MTEINIEHNEAIQGKYERYREPYLYEPQAIYTAGQIKNSLQLVLELAAGTGSATKHTAEKIGYDAKHEIVKEGMESNNIFKTEIVETIHSKESIDSIRSKLNGWIAETFK